jgi:hypothetical protein
MLHARCSTRSCVSWVIDTATRRLCRRVYRVEHEPYRRHFPANLIACSQPSTPLFGRPADRRTASGRHVGVLLADARQAPVGPAAAHRQARSFVVIRL